MEGEKKPVRLWPLWSAAVLFAVGVVYPLSIGPALWISGWAGIPWLDKAVNAFYVPAWFVWFRLPDDLRTWYAQYIMWWVNHIPS